MSGDRPSALFTATIENKKGISNQVAITFKEADPQNGSYMRVTPKGTGTTVSVAAGGISAAGIAAVPSQGAIVGAVIHGDRMLKGKASGPITLVKQEGRSPKRRRRWRPATG